MGFAHVGRGMVRGLSPASIRGNRRGGVIAGCLIALGVLLVILVIVGIIVAVNWRSWTSRGLHSLVQTGVSSSAMPAEEQSEVMAVVDKFTAQFEAGDVSARQFGNVFKELAESPIIPAMIVMSVEADYITKSTLGDEEKATGSKDLSRFVRGVYDGSISQTKIDDVTEPIHAAMGASNKIAVHSGNVNIELKRPEDVTPEELRQFLANAKAEADKAGVPDERFEIDWSDELQKVIDRATGRAPTQPEPPAEEQPGGG